jgi:hypothetical protein
MNASLWLAAGIACAQLGSPAEPAAAKPAHEAASQAESGPPPRPVASKITDVTVYQGQALVTREVSVPEGEGTRELLVTPLPVQTEEGSLYAEGAEGLRVLSTRFRTRAVKEDTREEVRAKEVLLKTLKTDSIRLNKELAVQAEDLKYLEKLGGFTSTALSGLTEKGRLDSEAIVTLSKFIMETRSAKSKAEVALRKQLEANSVTAEFTTKQLAELTSGTSRLERDAVIVVQKLRPAAGTVRLGYLVNAANWWPQYRLRGGAGPVPVRLEYLAAVTQQSGESWSGVRVTLSTTKPSLDAAPPDLIALKMDVPGGTFSGPIDAHDDRSQRIIAELAKPVSMPFGPDTALEDVIKYVKSSTKGPSFADGIPIYVDPIGLSEADKNMSSTVHGVQLEGVPLRTTLKLLLKQLDLTYVVSDGLLRITSMDSLDQDAADDHREDTQPIGGMMAGMGGMGDAGGAMPETLGLSVEQLQAARAARVNVAAATAQASELRVISGQTAETTAAEKAGPSITFPIAGRLDIPSRRDPQLLEVARVELPAEYFAKAVPVMTPRVYRLAKLTNKSELVLLPGEATVYVGTDFVGRMRLPLVAAGEPFIAGFGVDTQLQVSRRLVHKSRTVQGGNQIFNYEFRIGLRNYRANPVKVELWDRLPKPEGETIAVNLVRTSVDLSTETSYQRTGRADNLLLWDITVPPGTIGEKTIYLTYEFRLEYARDLPQPRFVSGGLREGPIGGGAMAGMGGGMGGMMGGMGMRSVRPHGD